MTASPLRTIAVVGATGMQGTAVTRRLLDDGWGVRALTRKPRGKRARALATKGAKILEVDAADAKTLLPAFDGAHGVFNVQNHHISGYEGEIAQGTNVAEAAKTTGVAHLVYGSAGTGSPGTGVGSWETKEAVARHMRSLELPLTVLRPMAFMELMTERKFYPAASTWHVMPKLMGGSRPVGWLAVEDLAAIVAMAFADPDRFLGRELALTGDVRTIEESRETWREVTGRDPRRFPMPVWLFERFSGKDETTMWRWLRTHEIDLDPGPTRALLPNALTVRSWIARRQGRQGEDRDAPRASPDGRE